MTRPLPTLREFRKAYEETGSEPASDWQSCPLGVVACQLGVEDGLVDWAFDRWGCWVVTGFTGGFDDGPNLRTHIPDQHRARYLAAFKHGRRVRRALIGGDK